MSNDRTFARATTTAALLAGLALSACSSDPTPLAPQPPDVTALPAHADLAAAPGPHVSADLAALRRLTAPFHNFEKAKQAGWSAQITSCLDSQLGAQGFHYGNPANIDAEANLLEPELLLYEPQKNGRLRLVGVEYIVPLEAWTSADPPTLFGQEFHVNQTFGVWALHVWLWRYNPSGLYADWNPLVSCEAAP